MFSITMKTGLLSLVGNEGSGWDLLTGFLCKRGQIDTGIFFLLTKFYTFEEQPKNPNSSIENLLPNIPL